MQGAIKKGGGGWGAGKSVLNIIDQTNNNNSYVRYILYILIQNS